MTLPLLPLHRAAVVRAEDDASTSTTRPLCFARWTSKSLLRQIQAAPKTPAAAAAQGPAHPASPNQLLCLTGPWPMVVLRLDSFGYIAVVRIHSTTPVRLLRGFSLIPSRISGKMTITLDTTTMFTC